MRGVSKDGHLRSLPSFEARREERRAPQDDDGGYRWWARRKSAFAHPTMLPQFAIARLGDGTFALTVTPRSKL
jgi:hypothetical protein